MRICDAPLPAGRRAIAGGTCLSSTSVLLAGLGSGFPIAELLVRKGIGRLAIADAAGGRAKAEAVRKRLLAVDPLARIAVVAASPRGLADVLGRVDYAVDALELGAFPAKIALHRAGRRKRRTILSPCPVLNGAALWVFTPEGPGFERFLACDGRRRQGRTALRVLQRLVPHAPPMPEDLRRAVAGGERTPPLDAVGVGQAAVLAVAAIENLALGRHERVVTVPRGLLVDVSEPLFGSRILEPG